MKKGLLFIAGGMLLAMASCQNEANTGTSDAQIDSMVNARVEELRTEMMMQNDSLINAMAIMKADSICGAKTAGTSTSGTKKPSTPAKPSKPVEPTKPDNTKTSTRPGATNQGGTKTTDRPGATNSNTPKATSDRPGATNK
ncbi:MAG: hypothetical protein EOP51_06570 [Sphingobacteriales bacterium]|nr:MAG: hypothetical protein EOP51_06570 [Sphingobacteriales bacterium]